MHAQLGQVIAAVPPSLVSLAAMFLTLHTALQASKREAERPEGLLMQTDAKRAPCRPSPSHGQPKVTEGTSFRS